MTFAVKNIVQTVHLYSHMRLHTFAQKTLTRSGTIFRSRHGVYPRIIAFLVKSLTLIFNHFFAEGFFPTKQTTHDAHMHTVVVSSQCAFEKRDFFL
jgi:hypothetical protein